MAVRTHFLYYLGTVMTFCESKVVSRCLRRGVERKIGLLLNLPQTQGSESQSTLLFNAQLEEEKMGSCLS